MHTDLFTDLFLAFTDRPSNKVQRIKRRLLRAEGGMFLSGLFNDGREDSFYLSYDVKRGIVLLRTAGVDVPLVDPIVHLLGVTAEIDDLATLSLNVFLFVAAQGCSNLWCS